MFIASINPNHSCCTIVTGLHANLIAAIKKWCITSPKEFFVKQQVPLFFSGRNARIFSHVFIQRNCCSTVIPVHCVIVPCTTTKFCFSKCLLLGWMLHTKLLWYFTQLRLGMIYWIRSILKPSSVPHWRDLSEIVHPQQTSSQQVESNTAFQHQLQPYVYDLACIPHNCTWCGMKYKHENKTDQESDPICCCPTRDRYYHSTQ